jgi:hypothetical protein
MVAEDARWTWGTPEHPTELSLLIDRPAGRAIAVQLPIDQVRAGPYGIPLGSRVNGALVGGTVGAKPEHHLMGR